MTPRPTGSNTLALFWFLYTGALGIFFPFFSLYLRENAGLSASEVGAVLAVGPLVGTLAQPLWGQVADRTGSRTRVLLGLTLGSTLGYAALSLAHGFGAIVLGFAFLALFSTSMIPMTLSVTLALVRDASPDAFGRARVWGTIGFLVLVVLFPIALPVLGAWLGDPPGAPPASPAGGREAPSQPGLGWMFACTAALSLAAALVCARLPATGEVARRARRGDARRLLRHGPMLRLLAVSFGTYLALQGPIHFFPLFVRDRGGSLETLSHLWVLMLALEIPLVAFSGATLRRFGPRGLLAFALAASGVRWTVSAMTGDFTLFAALQLLHGPVVAGLLGGPLYTEATAPPELGSTAQALLATLGVGLGGILSQLASGAVVDRFGIDALYLASGLGSLALAALLPVILPRPRRPEDPAEAH